MRPEAFKSVLGWNDYMLSLRERVQRSSHHINASPQVGEVVLIKDNLPRS